MQHDITVITNLYFTITYNVISELAAPIIYGNLFEANNYLSRKLNNTSWLDADTERRINALSEATRLIDSLNFIGKKYKSCQILQFPRGTDIIVPKDIRIACYEIALKLLDGYDPDFEIENLGSTKQGIGGLRDTYDRSFVLEHIRAGIPSPRAWTMLKPYLIDPNTINLSRVN